MTGQKWEYLVISLPTNNQEEAMNKLGEMGWELATSAGILNSTVVLFFKRPKV